MANTAVPVERAIANYPVSNILPASKTTTLTSKGTAVSDVTTPYQAPASAWDTILQGLKSGLESFATSAIESEKTATSDANELTKQWYDDLNLFNADQAQLQRDWSDEQRLAAEKYQTSERLAAEAWNEKMSDTSYQRVVEDLRKAGLNPALAFQNGGASTPTMSGGSAVTMSGSSASGSMTSAQKANISSAKSADIKMLSDLVSGTVSVFNSLTTSASKVISKLIPW